jgi:hypothetical protein
VSVRLVGQGSLSRFWTLGLLFLEVLSHLEGVLSIGIVLEISVMYPILKVWRQVVDKRDTQREDKSLDKRYTGLLQKQILSHLLIM